MMYDFYDLYGKEVEIKSCINKYSENKRGTFISESKNMIFLSIACESNNQIKKISKKEIDLLKVYSKSGVYFISGHSLKGRPEERISKLK